MKTPLPLAVAALLLMAAAIPCPALQHNMDVSAEKARELGVTLRSSLNGESGVAVWIEFKTVGALANFMRVDLDISVDGKRLVDAPLEATRPTADSVSARFSADPARLANSVLTIVVNDATRTRIGYQFKVKDFIKTEKKP